MKKKKKGEVRDTNSQLKYYISDLKASMFALKETCISCSHRAEIFKNLQSLIL